MKKLLAFMAILFLVTSCTVKKTEEKKEDNTKIKTNVETSTGKTKEVKKEEAPKKEETKTETSGVVDGLEFTFINDKNEKISNELKIVETINKQIEATPALKGAKLTNLDFSDAKAKKILNDNEIKEIPVLLVNKNKWEKNGQVNPYLKKTKTGLFLVQPGFYNFETKKYNLELGSLCGNGIDDNGDGKKDCEDDSCLQSNKQHHLCDKEVKKAQEEYLKKQAEKQKQTEKAQAEKLAKIKSDKPNVDLYVMSYCPYGTQAEKPFTSIMEKFGKDANVDIKFVQYVMHTSQGEGKENLKQYCIKTTQKEKYVGYLKCFLKAGNSQECMKENKIDTATVDTCIKETDKKFDITKKLADKSKRFPDFDINKETALKAGVQGSPTLVINGVKIDGVERTERGFAKVICNAFKKAPAICSDLSKFSNKGYKPGFGFDAPSANANAQAAAGCAQ